MTASSVGRPSLLLAGMLLVWTAALGCGEDGAGSPAPIPSGGSGGTATASPGGSSAGGAGDGGAAGGGGATPAPPTCDEPVNHRYFVSPDGDDANPGTEALPWQTIQRATEAVEAGDGVFITTGTYPERVVIATAGLPDAPIIFTAAPGAEVTIDGGAIELEQAEGLVEIQSDASYVELCGLIVQGSAARGVSVSGADHVSLLGLRVEDSGQAAILVYSASDIVVHGNATRESGSSGVGVWRSSRVLVRGNEVVNARNVPSGQQESISIASTEDFEVVGNEIYNDGVEGYLGNPGIDVKESSRVGKVHHNYIHDFLNDGGIYLDAWTAGLDGGETLHAVDVYDNLLVDTGGITVGSERGGTAEDINIYNNILIRSSYVGISVAEIHAGAQGPGLRRNIAIFNNTIHGATSHGGAGIYLVAAAIENITVRNNVVAFGDEFWVGQITAADDGLLGELTVDHNVVFGRTECSQTYPDCVELSEAMPGNVTADPLFVDPSTGDLHLRPGSPAIDAGVAIPLLTADYDGTPRPQGAGVDVGAFEASP